MTDPTGKTAVSAVLEAARRLAPTLTRRATEIETARRVPRDLLEMLLEASCFRILIPASHGGIGADLSSGMNLFETLARADASVGWIVMIGGTAWIDLVGLPRRAFDELFAAGRDVIFAGVFNPSGAITAVEGGYRVTGRWSFASGCEHASWLYCNNVERIVDGHPHLRLAVLPPDQVAIEDTWEVSGLCGTGSHHFHADNVFVPAARTLVPLAGEPCLDATISRFPTPSLLSLSIAAVAIGIGQGALDDIFALAVEKTPLLAAGKLAESAQFQVELSAADAKLRAARALLHESAEESWAALEAGSPLTLHDRARLRAGAIWATKTAVAVVTSAYRAGGGSALYRSSPLQRRLRDINALAQHFLLREDTLTTAGAILAGQDVSVMLF